MKLQNNTRQVIKIVKIDTSSGIQYLIEYVIENILKTGHLFMTYEIFKNDIKVPCTFQTYK